MADLTIGHFDEFFRTMNGHEPYPWQAKLAEEVTSGEWPSTIDLPTGCGKTACIDVAIFALACQATMAVEQRVAPRRVFFCVNRRVIVDEAYDRARRLAWRLWEAEQSGPAPLAEVAAALRSVAGAHPSPKMPPIDVLELRGGIYRDNRWARSIAQPTIVCTTIDQIGSRLLFRGYGVSSNSAPIQAALIAYDSLVLLDEAHISNPFLETLNSVRRYLDPAKWSEGKLGLRPMTVVAMTATPPKGASNPSAISLGPADRAHAELKRRLGASKLANLRLIDDRKLVGDAVAEAIKLGSTDPAAIGIIVNRVATAKAVFENLLAACTESNPRVPAVHSGAVVELVIGSMRPLDRDVQAERLASIVGPNRPAITEKTSFVVSTQCLEVGADYDFDALVTECASLDALKQRFGRLNRAGRLKQTIAVIMAGKKSVDSEDAIYGEALGHTWRWLDGHAKEITVNGRKTKTIDLGIHALGEELRIHTGDGSQIPGEMLTPSSSTNAPVLLTPYIDLWCQTSPRPVPDPDVALFLHGPDRGETDVQVCWRGDIGSGSPPEQWCDVISLLPPTATECMRVPIGRLRAWLTSDDAQPELAGRGDTDLLGQAQEESRQSGRFRVDGVVWRGSERSKRLLELHEGDDLRPGDTIVLPVAAGGWNELGHVPPGAPIDIAERASYVAHGRVALRIHPSMNESWPAGEALRHLLDRATHSDEPPTDPEWRNLLAAAADELGTGQTVGWCLQCLSAASCRFRAECYPDKRGWVLTTRDRVGSNSVSGLPALDDGEDAPSRLNREAPVLLSDHADHVVRAVEHTLCLVRLEGLTAVFRTAAKLHDLGKADERFQALMRRTDRTDAWLVAGLSGELLAKSDGMPLSLDEHIAARQRAGIPGGFRHETLSLQLAELSGQLSGTPEGDDLVLHLIAAHHGFARPFAPVVLDDELPGVRVNGISLSSRDRAQLVPAHRPDSGIAERFWSLTRRYGWWGLAYLEAVFRLSDQQTSAAEDQGEIGIADRDRHPEVFA
ncbi:MAG: type I-U CRISPR-associated helicase/endonuclease Cas3 [Phycisphaerae bacterium]|nr:type I-U CRISPR-associated helicase/endonuclease Cas3 [Phycisphaerae bacterium]